MFDVLKTLSSLVKAKHQVAVLQKAVKKNTEKNADLKPVEAKEQKASEKVDQASVHEAATQIVIAQAKAKEIIVEARDEAFRIRRDCEEEARKRYEALDRRTGILEEREKRLHESDLEIQKRLAEIEVLKKKLTDTLESVAHLTGEEARAQLLSETKEKMKAVIAREIKEAEIQARETADVKAREILVDAMRHGATDYVPEYTVSIIKVADEDVKGRIIGKEGRNIRAFETATGVDVDLDEEKVIRLSCFDPVRREIARIALERLLRDGRVQPGRIEEVVEQVKKEIERIMFEEGQKLCHAIGVYNLPSPIVALLGRFKYRFSYGQNMIAHTLEETKIGVAVAREVGADANIVRLGCLLHDIGKVITDKEGSHVELGVEFLKKYGLPSQVIDCVAQHHEDTPFSSIESVITYIADAISGGRPGARYENYDEYMKRLKDLEEIAKAKHGVREAFAFQAGRELRVVVDPGVVDDATATVMARDLKEEIKNKVTFPGQVKITVVRELRAVEVAK